jgi:hypothetical protein
MSTMPDHLRPITVEIPVTWTAEQALAVWEMLDQLREKIWARYSSNCKICWPRSSDALTSTTVTRVVGLSTSNRLIVQRLNHRPQRPSCCSIKTAILPSRPARTHAVARSGSPGCPQGIAVGGAQRPGRLRARRHPHRRDGRQRTPIDRPPPRRIKARRLDADSCRR